MITRIHVNGQSLKANRKIPRADGVRRNTVFTAKDYKSNRMGHLVTIAGPSKLVYQPDHPMKSGAVAWIETEAPVSVYVDTGHNYREVR